MEEVVGHWWWRVQLRQRNILWECEGDTTEEEEEAEGKKPRWNNKNNCSNVLCFKCFVCMYIYVMLWIAVRPLLLLLLHWMRYHCVGKISVNVRVSLSVCKCTSNSAGNTQKPIHTKQNIEMIPIRNVRLFCFIACSLSFSSASLILCDCNWMCLCGVAVFFFLSYTRFFKFFFATFFFFLF